MTNLEALKELYVNYCVGDGHPEKADVVKDMTVTADVIAALAEVIKGEK